MQVTVTRMSIFSVAAMRLSIYVEQEKWRKGRKFVLENCRELTNN